MKTIREELDKPMKQKAEETETIKPMRVEISTMQKVRKLAIEEGRSIQGQIRWMLKNYNKDSK